MEMCVSAFMSWWQLSKFTFIWLLVNYWKSFSDAFFRDVITCRVASPDAKGYLTISVSSIIYGDIKTFNNKDFKIDSCGNLNKVTSDKL